MKVSKQLLTIILIVIVIMAVAVLKFLVFNSNVKIDSVLARSIGPVNAKVNITEFIDFECPACAHGAMILKQYMALYPNQIHLQVKYYPLMNIHRHALQVASYGECLSRQGKFWPFFDPLMAQQQQWSQLINTEGVFDQLAQAAGANMDQLKACVVSEDVSKTIMAERTAGRSMGVQSTPTYFINNKMIVGSKSLVDELNTYFPNAPKK